jgi:translation initiation factor IF-2
MKTKTAKPHTPQHSARPPIVVVMGHIDHGKTSLLDYIRKTKVAEKEAGGITQGIGAYQIEQHGKKITFIDTPGHETFSAMRARGAHVADVAVLVVAADEGVKPQTEEAIKIIKATELPFVVAINKVDKSNADPNRVKQDLAGREVLVEGYGGTVPVVELSAKTGEGTETLLETILLLAELEELTMDISKPGTGVVIESHLDPRRGASATILIEDGAVKRGDFIVIGSQITPVRIFENFRGESINEANASDPIRITGFGKAPELGEQAQSFRTRSEAESAKVVPATPGEVAEVSQARNVVQIIVKADTRGSREAIEQSLLAIGSEELGNHILRSDVGDVTETDVKMAGASKNSFIIGFKVKVPPKVIELAERSGVVIIAKDIIYELLDAVKATMVAKAPFELVRVELGKAKILARFKEEKGKQIVGGKVESGLIRKGMRFDIIRNQIVFGKGKIMELQKERKATDEVPEGSEFGLLADADMSLAPGDTLAVYTEEKIVHKL